MAALLLPAVWAETPKPKPEPRVFSIYPLGEQPGAAYDATIRGVALHEAQAIWFETDSIHARVDKVDRDPEADPGESTPTYIVNVHVTVDPGTKPGSYPFRVVTRQGVSNAASMRVTGERTIIQVDDGSTSEPENAPRLSGFPLVVNGRIAKKGEVNYYSFETQPGEELSFEVFSGFAPFDPALTIFEPSGSWFDAHRLNRVAFRDEPLWYPDFSTDTRLVHRFEHGGRFLARVEGFEGRGSPNDVYQLRISTGRSAPSLLRALSKAGWQERTFTRHITADWLERLRERGAPAGPRQELETFRAVKEPASSSPVMKVPGIVEGVLSQPGEVHRISFHVKAQDIVLEVETPDATMPLFNPVVRVLDSAGHEVVTNVYTQLNNCGGYMMKMIEPKAIVAFHADGDYILQIHDITTDNADPSFVYRVLIRPQIPHLGKVEVEEERVNLTPGIARQVSVLTEREEDYSGLVAVSVEGLPPGVVAVTGSAPEEEKPPLMNGGKVERYFPKSQKSVLLLTAAPDAPLTPMPQMARVIVRAILENKVTQPLATVLVPVMVVATSAETAASLSAPAGKP